MTALETPQPRFLFCPFRICCNRFSVFENLPATAFSLLGLKVSPHYSHIVAHHKSCELKSLGQAITLSPFTAPRFSAYGPLLTFSLAMSPSVHNTHDTAGIRTKVRPSDWLCAPGRYQDYVASLCSLNPTLETEDRSNTWAPLKHRKARIFPSRSERGWTTLKDQL
jgi:hypothetical protein